MLSLSRTNELVVTDSRVHSKVQFIHWRRRNILITPPLVVSSEFYFTNLPRNCLSRSNYIINLSSMHNPSISFHVPNRVVNISLRWSNIYCTNKSIHHRLNTRKRPLRLPKSILIVDLLLSRVYEPPIGFFICVILDSDGDTKQIKTRESALRVTHVTSIYMKYSYVSKSVKFLSGFGHPSPRVLRVRNKLDLGIYNTRNYIRRLLIHSRVGNYWDYKSKNC